MLASTSRQIYDRHSLPPFSARGVRLTALPLRGLYGGLDGAGGGEGGEEGGEEGEDGGVHGCGCLGGCCAAGSWSMMMDGCGYEMVGCKVE